MNVGSSNSITYTPFGSTVQQTKVQFESQSGSNINLQPSTATTWSAGFGYTPKALKGLTVTLDYYETHQVGLPGSVNQQTIVQSVENLGSASPYAPYIHFGNVDGPTPTAPGQISTHPKSSVWIFAPTINLGGTWTKGIDASIEYEWDSHGFGKFDIKTDATIYNSF